MKDDRGGQQPFRDGITPMRGLFITAVGTGIGKTLVTTILCHQLTRAGQRIHAIKPLVSGFSPDDTRSDPALIIRSLGREPTPQSIEAIAPWRFAAPLSPHLAARKEGRTIEIDDISDFCRPHDHYSDCLWIVEGAGGVMSPITREHTGLDLMARLGYPVILVTGSYLGALSHTLTAVAALRGRGVGLQTIIVSESEECVGLADTVGSLRQFTEMGASVYALPRLAGNDEEKWRGAPTLIDLWR
jgi:dethiobiotin synthetase